MLQSSCRWNQNWSWPIPEAWRPPAPATGSLPGASRLPCVSLIHKDLIPEHRHHLDRHQYVGQLDTELGDRACWRIDWEVFCVLFIETREVARSREQPENLDDIFERCTGG